MKYNKIFNPGNEVQDFREDKNRDFPGDCRDGTIYSYTEDIILSINIALATGRPLLVRGPTGCGKSSIAYNVARVLKRRYYEFVITSRTNANDLLWRFDPIRRLADVYRKTLPCDTDIESFYPYIEPGILWWAIDPESAQWLGYGDKIKNDDKYKAKIDPALYNPDNSKEVVILIDEIDKAEPDVPNNLLVPLGSFEFIIDEIQKPITLKKEFGVEGGTHMPLVFITTNEERKLPEAFIRRCVILKIEPPDRDRLIAIAEATFGSDSKHKKFFNDIYSSLSALSENKNPEISIAEYLDAVRACEKLLKNIKGDLTELMNPIIKKTVWKKNA